MRLSCSVSSQLLLLILAIVLKPLMCMQPGGAMRPVAINSPL